MKKLLALTLALTLACSLCVPALAAEDEDVRVVYDAEATALDAANDGGELRDVADESPEVQALLQEMYDEGLLQENTDYDLSYFEEGAETPPPMDPDETDPVDEYIAAHPEEMAALDVDALLADWGYGDPREAFMEDWGDKADTFEEVVAWYYADNRVDVLSDVALAAEYKAEHPEDWAAFDAYRYFAGDVQSDYMDGRESVERYMAYRNLLSEAEFTDMMFARCITIYERYDPTDWEYGGDDPDAEPALTLVINGVASDVAISANDWTTYADAAALRGILGDKAVAPTYEGPVAVREAAENAGWEVEWYDAGWGDKQVCLWNKDAFLAEVKDRTEPFQTFYDTAMENSRNTIFAETPQRATQTATVTFQRFNSLDGDKTYTMKFRVESVWQKGVVDYTVTFDVSQLLAMFTADELEAMAADAQLSLGDLERLFSAGKAEFIVDYNSGGVAYNIPLLGLIDEDLEGWQTSYDPMLSYSQMNVNYAEIIYENMMITASWMGGLTGREEAEDTLEALGIYFAPDSVQTTGSTVTWTLETDKVNAALSKLIGDGTGTFSFFKKFDVNMTFNTQGKTDLKLALRPDIDGIVAASTAETEETNAVANSLMRWLLGCLDMELTATANGDADKATETVKLHIKNFGAFDVNAQSTTKSSAEGPRQLAEVERTWVVPAEGATVTFAR